MSTVARSYNCSPMHLEPSFRRVPALGGPSRAFRPWDWMTMNAPHFDPTGRFIALVRQAPVGAQPVGPPPHDPS